MALENLKGLTQDEQFEEAAKFAGVPVSVLRSQWRVESGEGKNMLSPAGAEGHFQIMPVTRATWEGRLGKKLDPYDFSDALVLAAHTMKENMQLAKGNVANALRWYNAGAPSRWNNEETHNYVRKVLGGDAGEMMQTSEHDLRGADFESMDSDTAWSTSAYDLFEMQQKDLDGAASKEYLSDVEKGIIAQSGAEAATAALVGGQDPAAAAMTARTGTRANVTQVTDTAIQRLGTAPVGTGGNSVGWEEVMDRSIDAEAQAADLEAITMGDKFVASLDLNTVTSSLLHWIEKQNGPQSRPDANFNYMDHIDKIEEDRSEDEIAELRGARSVGEVGLIKRRQDDERESNRVLSAGSSTGAIIGYSVAAGVVDPVGWLAGFGVGKAFQVAGVGSRAAFAAGNVGKGFGLAGAEGAAGNVLATGVIEAMGNHQSSYDYAAAAGFGFLIGSGFGAIEWRGAAGDVAKKDFADLAERFELSAAAQNKKLYEQAAAEAGPGASADEIAAAAARINAEQEQRILETVFGDIPDDHRMFPRTDTEESLVEIGSDFDDGADTAIDVPSSASADMAAMGDFVRTQKGRYVFSESSGLRDAVAAAETDGKVTTLLDGVINHAGVPDHLKQLATKLRGMAEQFSVRVIKDPDPESKKSLVGGLYRRDSNEVFIRQATPDIVVHEVLHGVTANILAARRSDLAPELRAPVAAMEDMLEHVRAQLRETDVRQLDDGLRAQLQDPAGGLSSTAELITYGMTNKSFQTWLSTLPSPQPGKAENAWAWFKNLVADFFKLNQTERTALDDLIERSGNLLDTIDENRAPSQTTLNMERMRAVKQSAQGAPAPADALPNAILNTRAKRKAAYKKYGLDVSLADDAERKIVAEVFARAEQINGANPIDAARLRPLLAKAGWEATSTRMLLSDNPVMRAFAIVALENPEGAAGRRVTASMTKAMRERVYLGDTLRQFENAYTVWRNRNGGSALKDFHDDTLSRRFNREVYAERDRRWMGKEGQPVDEEVRVAADALDAGYQRMGRDQAYVGTIGSKRLDYDKAGYQPRRAAPGQVAQLSDTSRKAFVQALSSEFQATAGFDKAFSDSFAIKYIERIQTQAKGAYDVPMNLHDDGAADIVRDSLRALSLSEEQIVQVMGRFSRGGASHTKARIDADLTTMYDDGAGGNIQLMDLMNTDNISLFRSYARRVSGEVSLAKYGIMGEQGLKELRMAMSIGPDGMKSTAKEMESFDQVAAEFLGKPFGTQLGKWADNARTFTSALRLGGMGFNQFGEYANGIASVGVARSFKALASLPRLMAEVRALKSGKPAENSLLGSMELYGGDFGMDGYRMRGMLDVNDGYEVYGTEALTVFDKAIRAGAHGNRILSGHRAMTAVQIRGMSEQIVAKSLRYIREGKEDAALDDMGITPAVREAMKAELHKVATFGKDGEVTSFDITKLSNNQAAHAYMVAVQRGSSQIIQHTYIGETGKWAHDGWLKMLTQFRTYGITATQKQWRRQSFTHGTHKALMYMMGAMSVAIPIHMARVQLRSLGRADREEFLDRELSPLALGRATMNYVAAAGLLPDVLDISSGLTGGAITGGRAGNNTPFVGGQIVPAAGVVNDIWRAAKTRDPHQMVKLIPGSNLPYLQGAVNQLDE